MKAKFFLLAVIVAASIHVNAQDRSVFRSGYFRFGINTLGSDLDPAQTPKQNIFDGRYGAGAGFALELGRIFYFNKKVEKTLVNYGLDWTYFSLSFNTLDKWEAYGDAAAPQNYDVDGEKIAAAVSTKIGPVVSINLVERVVLDARFQLAPTFRLFDLSYYENENTENERSFSFTNYRSGENDESYDAESTKNRIAYGLQTNFGLTLRRKAIGISLDYLSGKVKSNYEALDQTGVSFGKEKIKADNLQVKLSLTL
jgi:hypothetical protein